MIQPTTHRIFPCRMKKAGTRERGIARISGDSFHFFHPAPNGGPDDSIRIAAFYSEKIVARRSRSRRIGELLKKLELTEDRRNGIPKRRAAMEKNGSPPPCFSTDEGRTFFLSGRVGHRWVRARPSGEAPAGCLAECRPKLDAGDGSDECIVVVFDALDEVCLSEGEVGVVRLLDLEAWISTAVSYSLGSREQIQNPFIERRAERLVLSSSRRWQAVVWVRASTIE